ARSEILRGLVEILLIEHRVVQRGDRLLVLLHLLGVGGERGMRRQHRDDGSASDQRKFGHDWLLPPWVLFHIASKQREAVEMMGCRIPPDNSQFEQPSVRRFAERVPSFAR